MATKLTKKPVVRELELLRDNRIVARPSDQVIVSLYPNGTIGFRQKRSRKEYCLPLATAYRMAVLAEAEHQKREKAKQRKMKKMGVE